MLKLWNVYLNGKLYDTVYFDTVKKNTAEGVRRELITIDKYPTDIKVEPA